MIGEVGSLTTQLYDKRDAFNFSIVNFTFIYSNIPESPAYGVFISQLIRYTTRVCSRYNIYGRHSDLVGKYNISVLHMLQGLFDNNI